MDARHATAETTREVLVFALGAEEYAVDILLVREIRGYEKVTPIPSAPAFVKGVINLRGEIVPVLDMRVKLGFPDPRFDAFTVVVILHIASRVIGVVVDAVSDVMRLTRDEVKPAPDLGAVIDTAFLDGIATKDERMVVLLNMERFLSAADLALLGADRAEAPLAA